jgi:glycosyltransferase involved in cell wall biosynthesis
LNLTSLNLSVVIPVLNERAIIDELVLRVRLSLESITSKFEIIIIDDGSSDETWKAISEMTMTDPRIKGIRFSRNFGHHFAISAGLHKSCGEWVVVMDGDLQDRPEVIPELYKKAKEGFEVVFVSRKNRPEKKWYLILQKVYYLILSTLTGIKFDSTLANFSIINQKVVEAFKLFPEQSRFYGSTIRWLGFNATSIQANHGKRFAGKTSYSLRKRFKLATDIMYSFSTRPLYFSIYLGLILLVFSASHAGWLLAEFYIYGYTINLISIVVILISFMLGLVLVFLGIIGAYVGKIFEQVKNRPLYVICETVNFD